jgi:hypothetical protein
VKGEKVHGKIRDLVRLSDERIEYLFKEAGYPVKITEGNRIEDVEFTSRTLEDFRNDQNSWSEAGITRLNLARNPEVLEIRNARKSYDDRCFSLIIFDFGNVRAAHKQIY